MRDFSGIRLWDEGRLVTVSGGIQVRIRPLQDDDDRFFHDFDRQVTDEDRRLRFFASLDGMSDRLIETLTHFDRSAAAAVIALDPNGTEMLGVARAHEAGRGDGEFALFVRSDLKGRGLGHALMAELVRHARTIGLTSLHGFVMRENRRMIDFARDIGFQVTAVPDEPGLVRARLAIAGPAPAGVAASLAARL